MKKEWEDNVPFVQAYLITYSQLRDIEEAELAAMGAFRGII